MRKMKSVVMGILLIASILTIVTPVSAATIAVNPGDSIQAAINSASAGDTILVHPGTYIEDLEIIGKPNLTLRSVGGKEVTTIRGVRKMGSTWPEQGPNINIRESDGFKLHGFTIESPDYEVDKYSSGIIIGSKNIEIFDNIFVARDRSISIQTWSNANPGDGEIDISGLKIYNNRFRHETQGILLYAVFINPDNNGSNVLIYKNRIEGKMSRAIGLWDRPNIIISENIIVTSLESNQDTQRPVGINIWGNTNNLTIAKNTIRGDTIHKGFYHGILVVDSAEGIIINNNEIYGNYINIENRDKDNILDARFNWWGSNAGPRSETILGIIEYFPWETRHTQRNLPMAHIVRILGIEKLIRE